MNRSRLRRPSRTALALLVTALAGCAAGIGRGGLAASLGPPVYYSGEQGERFVARYGSLGDGSLHFVRVQLPDGREFTLPQVVSASGVRYTDERELVWWTHQQAVHVEIRDAQGNWHPLDAELHEVAPAR